MTMTPTIYACPRHPSARVTLHVRGTAHCARCGKLLRRVQGAAEPQQSLFPEVKEIEDAN